VSSLGKPNGIAIAFFLVFIAVTLGITAWAAKKTKSTSEFYAAGGSVSAFQNGLALAGDFMSAASFLGIAGLVAKDGFDGLIYSVGWLVGWPIVMFLVAEPLRNLGKYTFADVVAYRLKQRPVRIAASIGGLTVIAFYLIAQMVGAGSLIRLLFGLDYELAEVLVGGVMLAYVLFGGMIATTWVQIVKAILLLGGALLLAAMVLAQFGGNPLALFAAASDKYGASVLAPGKLVQSPLEAISLGLALMFGTAGLPHILMRFYTVPDARAARTSVVYATGFIGTFYLVTFVLGFGAAVLVGRDAIKAVDPGGNMAAPMLAEMVGGRAFLGFISAVAFATILAVVAGLTITASASFAHDIYGQVIKRGEGGADAEVRVARIAAVVIGVVAIVGGIFANGQNIAFLVALAFAIAASANLPTILYSLFWKRFNTRGALWSIYGGLISAVVLITFSPTVSGGAVTAGKAASMITDPSIDFHWFPLANPGLVSIPLGFLLGYIGTITSKEHNEAKYAEMEVRSLTGAGAEKAVIHH
jgi:cation/acetate symporter